MRVQGRPVLKPAARAAACSRCKQAAQALHAAMAWFTALATTSAPDAVLLGSSAVPPVLLAVLRDLIADDGSLPLPAGEQMVVLFSHWSVCPGHCCAAAWYAVAQMLMGSMIYPLKAHCTEHIGAASCHVEVGMQCFPNPLQQLCGSPGSCWTPPQAECA